MKSKSVNCRITEADYEALRVNAEAAELTPSEYVRMLIRMPVRTRESTPDAVVLVDTTTLSEMKGELVRWGHHYNQGIHALNACALYASHGGSKMEYFHEQIGLANDRLDRVESGARSLSERIDGIEHYVLGD